MLLLERIIIASEEAVWDRVDIYRLCMLLLERIIIASEEAIWDRVGIYRETLYAIASV